MNVLIAEDEAPAARRLERILAEKLGARAGRVVVAPTVEAARTAMREERFDLLLLDLDLNGADGFSLLGDGDGPRVIVVSARSDRAIDAFNHAVVDFVTKPVAAERLALALDRAAARGEAKTGGALAVRSAGRIDLAAFADIVALSGADDYVEVVLADGRRFLHDTRLSELERRLPAGFARVHRSHIVNTAHLKAVRVLPGGRRSLELAGGVAVPVSRSRADGLERIIKGR